MAYLDMDITSPCLAGQANDYPCGEAGQIEKVDAALLKMMMDWEYEDIQHHHRVAAVDLPYLVHIMLGVVI